MTFDLETRRVRLGGGGGGGGLGGGGSHVITPLCANGQQETGRQREEDMTLDTF